MVFVGRNPVASTAMTSSSTNPACFSSASFMMACSEAVIHPIERAVVRHTRQLQRVPQLLEVAVAHLNTAAHTLPTAAR